MARSTSESVAPEFSTAANGRGSKAPLHNLLELRDCSDITIENVILRGAYHWCLVLLRSHDVTMRGIKILNGRVPNDDGIDICNCQNISIDRTFIRSDDDCIAIKGLLDSVHPGVPPQPVENLTITNSTFWCDRARVFLLGHESVAPTMQNIKVIDCDILHYKMVPFLLEPGEEMWLQHVLVENVWVVAQNQRADLIRLRPTVNQYMQLRQPGHINDVVFRDIQVTGDLAVDEGKVVLIGADQRHRVENVRLENVSFNHEPIDQTSSRIQCGENVNGLSFERSQSIPETKTNR